MLNNVYEIAMKKSTKTANTQNYGVMNRVCLQNRNKLTQINLKYCLPPVSVTLLITDVLFPARLKSQSFQSGTGSEVVIRQETFLLPTPTFLLVSPLLLLITSQLHICMQLTKACGYCQGVSQSGANSFPTKGPSIIRMGSFQREAAIKLLTHRLRQFVSESPRVPTIK